MGKLEEAEKEDRELRARLDKLSASLETQRSDAREAQARAGRDTDYSQAGRGMSLGFRAVAELLGGVLVGTAIGWQLDRWLSTKPFLMILFLFLGMGAGILNVVRAAGAAGGGRDSKGS
jgi:ATP synthase protein I